MDEFEQAKQLIQNMNLEIAELEKGIKRLNANLRMLRIDRIIENGNDWEFEESQLKDQFPWRE